jgi:hypothetical protein
MNRDWLKQFYGECGREVSLAYNVLNHTNSWGVTLVAGVLALAIIGTVRAENGNINLTYPTIIHWFYVIVAWIIMVRFFMRSCLALTNMYRWNTLIYAAGAILSLPEGHKELPVFERNFIKKVKAYFYDWKSPKHRIDVVWHSLKLIYLWFFLILLALIIWGLVGLERNGVYIIGVLLFVVPTALEIRWFFTWEGLRYEALDLEKEPEITQLWLDK